MTKPHNIKELLKLVESAQRAVEIENAPKKCRRRRHKKIRDITHLNHFLKDHKIEKGEHKLDTFVLWHWYNQWKPDYRIKRLTSCTFFKQLKRWLEPGRYGCRRYYYANKEVSCEERKNIKKSIDPKRALSKVSVSKQEKKFATQARLSGHG